MLGFEDFCSCGFLLFVFHCSLKNVVPGQGFAKWVSAAEKFQSKWKQQFIETVSALKRSEFVYVLPKAQELKV